VIIVAEKEKQTKKASTKKKEPVKYVHINSFLANRKESLSENVSNGFKIFMRGKTYQHSHEDFEKELEKFLKRKI
jgi:dihydroorotase-like cyclic amidohydrolase